MLSVSTWYLDLSTVPWAAFDLSTVSSMGTWVASWPRPAFPSCCLLPQMAWWSFPRLFSCAMEHAFVPSSVLAHSTLGEVHSSARQAVSQASCIRVWPLLDPGVGYSLAPSLCHCKQVSSDHSRSCCLIDLCENFRGTWTQEQNCWVMG